MVYHEFNHTRDVRAPRGVRTYAYLALFSMMATFSSSAQAISCDGPAPRDVEYYATPAEAQAACEAASTAYEFADGSCAEYLSFESGQTSYTCSPAASFPIANETTNVWHGANNPCPAGESPNPSTGVCEPDGLPGSCNDPAIQASLASVPIFPSVNYSYSEIPSSVFFNGDTVDLVSGYNIYCQQVTGYIDPSTEQTLECKWTEHSVNKLNDDFLIRNEMFADGFIATTISGDIECGTSGSFVSETVDLTQYAEKTEESVTDGSGTTTTEQSCWETRVYMSTTQVTEVCTICQTLVDGLPSNLTESCVDQNGDTTSDQGADGGTGDYSGGGFVSTSGAGTSGTTGTTPESGGTLSTATGANADVVTAVGTLTEEIEACNEAGGCEDFEEILEDYDGTADTTSITDAWQAIIDALTDEETDLTNVSQNPDGLTTGLDAGSITGFASWWPNGGSCTNFVIDFGQYGSGSIDCTHLETIKAIVTVFMWLWVLIHLRSVIFRPSATGA